MKKTMKKCLTLLLALAMLLAMAVPAAAATPYDKTITFTGVAEGDTVKAYQLMKYDANYNEYIFHEGFKAFAANFYDSKKQSLEEHLAESTKEHLTALMINYAIMTDSAHGGVSFPQNPVEAIADANNEVKMTLEPGYYLLLVSTTEQNNRTYMPVTVFVQVKNGNVKVYAAGSELAGDLTAVFKHEDGPAVNVRVSDDSRATTQWKETAGGRVGETMDFYMEVSIPAYESEHVAISSLIAKCQLAGLNYVADSMKATTLPNADSDAVKDAIIGTPVCTDGNLTVELDYSKIRSATGRGLIYLHFQATVAPDAVAESKASATAKLEYVFSMEADKTKTTADSTAAVYNYDFTLFKKSNELNNPSDAGSGHQPLAGAGFILYADEAMNTPVSMVKVDATTTTDAYYRPALAGEEGAVAQMDANMGNDNNTLSIRGLDVGSYYVKETKTPSGYYAPKGIFKLELTAERDSSESLVKTLSKGSVFGALKDADRALVRRNEVNKGLNRFEADLLNSSTPVLPTTGGVGTVMFTVIGLLCMGAALWFFLFARRRREDEQEQNKTTL
jgi:LPXTG-motif cell wall-anchored protein